MVQVVVDDDVEAAADQIRPMLALYIGGMGAKGANFHYDVFARMGYEDDCAQIQEPLPRRPQGRRRRGRAAVAWWSRSRSSGRRRRSPRSCRSWRDSLVTTMVVGGGRAELEVVAELVG